MKKLIRISSLLLLLFVAIMMSGGLNAYAAGGTRLTGYNAPNNLTEGQKFYLKGKITSSKPIKRIEIGVVYTNRNKWTSFKYDNKSLNTKSFDIAKYADPKIKFAKIKAGTYYYRIYAHTSDKKVHTLLNRKFTIKASTKAKTKSNVKSTKTKAISAKTKTGNVKKRNTTSAKKVVISGGNRPGNYKVGKRFNVRGTIKSNEIINKVEIGIVFATTNKWTEYKYEKKGVNSKTFDISRAASALRFDKLPGGKFIYRIYVHTRSGVKIAQNYAFTVTPSSKPKAAVNWAVKIANDNRFTYGKRPAANAIGCYFCGTNHGPKKYYKPKGYERTYVCLTFIGAAYAHGAHDSEILEQCKKGRMTMYETNDNFKKFSCWHKIGLCRDLKVSDLQPGDVIIKWSDGNDNNGHVCMYIGGNKIVEASGGGWGADSITVRSVASERLKSLSASKKNYVMRYIH